MNGRGGGRARGRGAGRRYGAAVTTPVRAVHDRPCPAPHGGQRRRPGHAGRAGRAGPRWERRRRGHRHQRRDRRDRARTSAAWAATCSRSSTCPAPSRPCARRVGPGRQRRRCRTRCAPRGTSRCRFRHDIRTVTVPGCVDGWVALHAALRPPARWPTCWRRRSRWPRTASRPRRCSSARWRLLDDDGRRAPGRAGRARPTGRARWSAGRARPAALRAIAEGGRAGFYERRVRRGPAGRSAPGYFTDDDLAAPPGRVGRARWPLDVVGASALDRAPGSPGLPDARRRRGSPRSSPCPTTPTTPAWAHLLIEAAIAAGHDRPEVLHDRADGDGPRSPPTASRPAATSIAADSTSSRRGHAADGRRRHHLPVRGRRRPAWRCRSSSPTRPASAAGWSSRAPGINLHNRGLGLLASSAGHPAEYGPGRRPPHTLCPLS